MTVIVALGISNTGSMSSALDHIGARHVTSARREDIELAERIILPGVGSFDAGMERLGRSGLEGPILEAVQERGVPILGVCLGMQLLLEGSEEGELPGLALVSGTAARLGSGGSKVPHVGFAEVEFPVVSLLGTGLASGSALYFTHSYALRKELPSAVNSVCGYDGGFVAAFEHGSVFGVQFHPEKSRATGLRVLANFVQHTGAR